MPPRETLSGGRLAWRRWQRLLEWGVPLCLAIFLSILGESYEHGRAGLSDNSEQISSSMVGVRWMSFKSLCSCSVFRIADASLPNTGKALKLSNSLCLHNVYAQSPVLLCQDGCAVWFHILKKYLASASYPNLIWAANTSFYSSCLIFIADELSSRSLCDIRSVGSNWLHVYSVV